MQNNSKWNLRSKISNQGSRFFGKSVQNLAPTIKNSSESRHETLHEELDRPAVDRGDYPCKSISVIVPVYNAMPYLTELLNSLEAQDLPTEDFDVIAVDDGSTDFSGEILDVYAARNGNFHVIHQENSGWPGKPRNVGIEASNSEFVFFCDADDHLGSEALRRMVEYARDHSSDVVVPKMIGVGGRRVQESLFKKTIEDVSLRTVFRSLSPQKLVRRSLLIDNDIRFHEEKVRLEDGIVMTACYLQARKISILSDYDYYFIRTRSVGTNISSAPIDPVGYVRSLREISTNLLERVVDREHAELLILDLFRRKGLRFYEPARFLAMETEVQQQWMNSHAAFINDYLPAALQQRMSMEDKELTEQIQRVDFSGVVETVRKRYSVDAPMETVSVTVDENSIILAISSLSELSGAEVNLKNRRGTKEKSFTVQSASASAVAGGNEFTVEIPRANLMDFDKEIIDVWTVATDMAGKSGVAARTICLPNANLPAAVPGVRIYSTAHGRLSLDLRN